MNQSRNASTGGQVLRRVYGHIVAQGLGAGKLTSPWESQPFARRNLNAVGQFGMASVIVLVAWVYWPGEAAAPALSFTAPSSVVAQPAASLASRTTEAAPPEVSVSVQRIAETKERFAALAVASNPQSSGNAAPLAGGNPAPFGAEILEPAAQPPIIPDETSIKPTPTESAESSVANGPSRPGGLSSLLASLGDVTAAPRQAMGQIVAGVSDLATGIGSGQVVAEAQPTRVPPPPPTPGPTPILVPGPKWVDFTPAAAPAVDHFWLGKPHPAGYNQLYSPNYQFGSTANERYRIHHGVDISSASGTPVLAMGEGEVVHAGPDNPTLLGPYNNFYGNAVVVRLNRRLPTFQGDQDVYVLLAHLSEVYVERGQQVTPDVVVGAVGMTGIAIGPHLHVEVRVGQNSYLHSVNPALWMENPPGTGSVAVRLLTSDGRSWSDARLSLLRYDGGSARWVRTIEIYPDAENISADPAWGENGALSQLAAGGYWIGGVINGEKFGQNITVYPGETTFVELRTQQ